MSQPPVNPLLRGVPLLADLPDLDGLRVLVRVDFNVPLGRHEDGSVSIEDDFRIRAALPTLRYLTDGGARVTVMTHLGRPDGKVDEKWSLDPLRGRLDELLPGVTLMENLRFSPGETGNDPGFVDGLVRDQDAYVNDAFGVSHRAHASVVGPPKRLPSAAGYLLERELEVLGSLLAEPARPFVAVVGGAKVADKLGVMHALMDRADALIVGGGMAFTFLAAMGHDVGGSMVDHTRLDDCRELLASGAEIFLPTDIVALEPGASFGPGSTAGEVRTMGVDLPAGWMGLDIGPETVARFAGIIAGAGTVLWNGPMGVFEDARFASGTAGVAEAMAEASGFTVVGGGDSASAVEHLGLASRIDFISTGGGASLELLEFGDLPGLAALRGAPNAPRSTV